MIQILYEIMESGVVSNKEILLRESEKGIVLRTVGTDKERIVRNLRQFYDLEEAKMMVRIMGQPMLKDLGYSNADLIVDMMQALLQPNITLNRNETLERQKAAVADVKPVFHKIKAGEMLLREGERVTAVQILKLRAIQEEQLSQRIAMSSMGAALIMVCVLLSAYVLRFRNQDDRANSINKDILFIAVVLCTFFVIAEVAGSLSRTLAQNTPLSFDALSLFYATPISSATMIVCLFLGLESAVLVAMILAIGAAIVFHGSFEHFDLFPYQQRYVRLLDSGLPWSQSVYQSRPEDRPFEYRARCRYRGIRRIRIDQGHSLGRRFRLHGRYYFRHHRDRACADYRNSFRVYLGHQTIGVGQPGPTPHAQTHDRSPRDLPSFRYRREYGRSGRG